MNQNPLSSLEEHYRQQMLNDRLDNIAESVQYIKGVCYMPKFIEVEAFTDAYESPRQRISINPSQIAYIVENDSGTFIHMSNNSSIHSTQSRDEILSLIKSSDASSNTYIK